MTTFLDLSDGTRMQLSDGTYLLLHFAADIVTSDHQIVSEMRNAQVVSPPRLMVIGL